MTRVHVADCWVQRASSLAMARAAYVADRASLANY